jgi:hypothetical protein
MGSTDRCVLREFVSSCGLDLVTTVNWLQANGVVSDNVVHMDDVALADQWRAIEWLSKQGMRRREA